MPAFLLKRRSSHQSSRKYLSKNVSLSFALGVGISLAASAATAADTVSKIYECELVQQAKDGWVPERLVVASEDDFKTAYVYDDFIHYSLGTPIKVIPRQTSAGKYRMNWELDNIKIRNKSFKTSSSIYLDTVRMRVGFEGTLKGYDNEIKGAGTCVLAPPKAKKK